MSRGYGMGMAVTRKENTNISSNGIFSAVTGNKFYFSNLNY